jgi:hypothetical protein
MQICFLHSPLPVMRSHGFTVEYRSDQKIFAQVNINYELSKQHASVPAETRIGNYMRNTAHMRALTLSLDLSASDPG